MSNLEAVNHLNYIGEDGMVYCRKEHVVKKVDFDKCFCCEYLFGSLQGEGVECYWDDVPNEFRMRRIHDPWREYERVSELIGAEEEADTPFDEERIAQSVADDSKNPYC